MAGLQFSSRSRSREEAEKPFWISYADLMTALMVLFLVVMVVAILSVTKKVSEAELKALSHEKEIDVLLDRFAHVAKESRFTGITINRDRRIVDFGTRAQFPFAKSILTTEQEKLLRAFVPAILAQANDDIGRRVLKEIVVDGFTDKTGTYLANLALSLERSHRVLCALFAPPELDETPMTSDQLKQIRRLFVVGGYSFNAAKETDEKSRRIEMRLRFLGVDEARPPSEDVELENFGTCSLRAG
jgi:flagellar motor protein MotB